MNRNELIIAELIKSKELLKKEVLVLKDNNISLARQIRLVEIDMNNLVNKKTNLCEGLAKIRRHIKWKEISIEAIEGKIEDMENSVL